MTIQLSLIEAYLKTHTLETKPDGTVIVDSDFGSFTGTIGHIYKSDPVQSDHHMPTAYTHGTAVSKLSQFQHTSVDYNSGNTKVYTTTVILPPGSYMSYSSASNQTILQDQNSFNRVQVECLAKLGEGKMDIGTTLGEAIQTAHSVADMANDVLNAALAIKRGDVKKLRQLFGEDPIGTSVASRWLQYQLAVKPLVSDLYSAAELHDEGISDRASKGSPSMGIKATRNIRSDWIVTDGEYSSMGMEKLNCTIRATIKDLEAHGLKKLGLSNPLAVAWELTPFSWLIDYVVPVGTMLKALSAPVGLEPDGSWVSLKVNETVKTKVQMLSGGSPIGDPVEVTGRNNAFRRYVISGFPSVVPYVKSPFTTNKVLNVIALAKVLSSR